MLIGGLGRKTDRPSLPKIETKANRRINSRPIGPFSFLFGKGEKPCQNLPYRYDNIPRIMRVPFVSSTHVRSSQIRCQFLPSQNGEPSNFYNALLKYHFNYQLWHRIMWDVTNRWLDVTPGCRITRTDFECHCRRRQSRWSRGGSKIAPKSRWIWVRDRLGTHLPKKTKHMCQGGFGS